MSSPRLSDTSFVVLGLIERAQPATPYDLKRLAAISTSHFWSLPHTQLYTECARLAGEGLLQERREREGRRRRTYTLTRAGREALERWRSQPPTALYELRDPGLLKLFFGADPAALASGQLEAHERRLASYEELRNAAKASAAGGAGGEEAHGALLALDAGIGHEREFVRFWRRVRDRG